MVSQEALLQFFGECCRRLTWLYSWRYSEGVTGSYCAWLYRFYESCYTSLYLKGRQGGSLMVSQAAGFVFPKRALDHIFIRCFAEPTWHFAGQTLNPKP